MGFDSPGTSRYIEGMTGVILVILRLVLLVGGKGWGMMRSVRSS
jgi:hypothetical protein